VQRNVFLVYLLHLCTKETDGLLLHVMSFLRVEIYQWECWEESEQKIDSLKGADK
jgi:hypothetical protein